MAITTVYDACHELETSLQILKEFVLSYITNDEIDFLSSRPTLDESVPLNKPVVYIEVLPGIDRNVGMGRKLSNGDTGKWHTMNVFFYWIITNDCGGMERVRQLSDSLRWAFFYKGNELIAAGLNKPVCSSLREIPQENEGPFFGARHMITFKTLISY